ncbi:MAG: SLATT domain-containing protein [Chloroflexi bacterium]|nr:SLATT domain-containing protein [Chloroflexota bacterium]
MTITPPSPQAKPAAAQILFTEEEARLRTELYLNQRVEYQDKYYERRIAEFTFNSDLMLWFSALLMGISTVISSYSVVTDRPVFAFVTALLPTFATAVTAFRSLYQWQRQATIYEDCWLALQQARLSMPDTDFLNKGDYERFFPELVLRAETVLRHEASQWGQMEQVPASPAFKTQETPAVVVKINPPRRRR